MKLTLGYLFVIGDDKRTLHSEQPPWPVAESRLAELFAMYPRAVSIEGWVYGKHAETWPRETVGA